MDIEKGEPDQQEPPSYHNSDGPAEDTSPKQQPGPAEDTSLKPQPGPAEDTSLKPQPERSDSVVDKIRTAREESTSNVDFIKRLFLGVCCGTVCAALTIGIMLAIPITNIVIGSMYKEDCPRERMIPIYLIVAGSFGIVKALTSMIDLCDRMLSSSSSENYTRPALLSCIDCPVGTFLGAWFIAGNVWIFRAYSSYQSLDPSASDYCHPTLYLYAFWSTLAVYLLSGAFLVIVCLVSIICCCCACCASST